MIQLVMDKQLTDPDTVAGKAFNIGGGPDSAFSILDLFEMLEELTERPASYRNELSRQADPRWYCSNTELAEAVLGWKKQYSVQNIVEELVNSSPTTS
jgi:CDP-paratose 2-epimerase